MSEKTTGEYTEFVKRCIARLDDWLGTVDPIDEVKCYYFHEFKREITYRKVSSNCTRCTEKFECYKQNFLPTMQPVEIPEL
jgi:hypothetical protein